MQFDGSQRVIVLTDDVPSAIVLTACILAKRYATLVCHSSEDFQAAARSVSNLMRSPRPVKSSYRMGKGLLFGFLKSIFRANRLHS